jgi:hypothetical protein
MAEVKQNYDSSRSFLLLTYKLYHKLDTLSGTNKAYCLTVFLSLLKYAWKSSGYKCSIRYATLIKDTKLSKMTIRRSCGLLSELGIIKIKRLPSANLYSINTTFLKSEVLPQNTQGYTREHTRVLPQNSIYRNINNINNNNELSKIDKIISDNKSNKDKLINELIKHCTLEELKEDKKNIYYCKLAIAEYAAAKNTNFASQAQIVSALKNIGGKKSNAFYRAKVAHNKKFNLDWKGNPKK